MMFLDCDPENAEENLMEDCTTDKKLLHFVLLLKNDS